MKREPVLCAICGIREATTRDHIPPRQIFVPPIPANLITVPACFACNNQASGYDERFVAMLGIHLANQGDDVGRRLFNERTMRTIAKNKRFGRNVMSRTKPVEVTTPGGIFVGKAHAVLWDSEAHTHVIRRMVRGLYCHHYTRSLGESIDIKVYWFREPPEFGDRGQFAQSNVGDAFIYWYGRAEGSPDHSLWLFQFYGGQWSGGFTEPRKEGAEQHAAPDVPARFGRDARER